MKFIVPQGQFCCIVGPSGCGKTTLLNLLSGLDENLDGTIMYQDNSIPKNWPIGYMFQEPRLMPWLTVKQNVAIVTQQTAEEIKLSETLINEMGLNNYMNSFPSELSGGMQRRVAIARAFVNRPKILLLDEPFISLDETVGNLLRQMLLKLWENQKTTIIFVTHDLREAIYMSDRILFLSKGPSKVIHDLNISINRPRELNDKKLDTLRTKLISNHPDILSGNI
jgi:NitT/TauT family transport system ATP-binding protein